MSDGAIEGRHCCGLDEWIGWRRKTRDLVGENLDREEIPRWEVECGGGDWIGEEWMG